MSPLALTLPEAVMWLTTNSFHFSFDLPNDTPSSDVGLNIVGVWVILLPLFNLNCRVAFENYNLSVLPNPKLDPKN